MCFVKETKPRDRSCFSLNQQGDLVGWALKCDSMQMYLGRSKQSSELGLTIRRSIHFLIQTVELADLKSIDSATTSYRSFCFKLTITTVCYSGFNTRHLTLQSREFQPATLCRHNWSFIILSSPNYWVMFLKNFNETIGQKSSFVSVFFPPPGDTEEEFLTSQQALHRQQDGAHIVQRGPLIL